MRHESVSQIGIHNAISSNNEEEDDDIAALDNVMATEVPDQPDVMTPPLPPRISSGEYTTGTSHKRTRSDDQEVMPPPAPRIPFHGEVIPNSVCLLYIVCTIHFFSVLIRDRARRHQRRAPFRSRVSKRSLLRAILQPYPTHNFKRSSGQSRTSQGA